MWIYGEKVCEKAYKPKLLPCIVLSVDIAWKRFSKGSKYWATLAVQVTHMNYDWPRRKLAVSFLDSGKIFT